MNNDPMKPIVIGKKTLKIVQITSSFDGSIYALFNDNSLRQLIGDEWVLRSSLPHKEIVNKDKSKIENDTEKK